MYTPKNQNIIKLSFAIAELKKYIQWEYFFHAWRMAGRYDGIEAVHDEPSLETWLRQQKNDTAKAEEAARLYLDALAMLHRMQNENMAKVQTVFRIAPAASYDEGILFAADNVYIPTLRQQRRKTNGAYLSLCDFVSEENDFVGVFAVSVMPTEAAFATDYEKLLFGTLCDRLAEAATERMHLLVRTTYWAYAPDECLSVQELHQCRYQGIRPAVGYPSLPDQSVIFRLQRLLPLGDIGISLTENGAMRPPSSTCGLMFAAQDAVYFAVGDIGDDQRKDYERRKCRIFQTDGVINTLQLPSDTPRST